MADPQDDVIDQRRAAREAAEEVAEQVEEVADESRGERREPRPASQQLEHEHPSSSARQLRESGEDREATLARIGSVQEELAR